MYVSYRWLTRHVDLEGISPEQLADDLTLSTAEVEGLERFAPHLSDVVVGHVLERGPHPDADKLGICKVDLGDGEEHQIVCGAPNVAGGLNVAVARLGTVLPGASKLKKAKIRGVESRGMICSERELELGDNHDGIWVLPDGLEVGAPVAAALGVDDWIIEIDNKSLTHRPDLWGHRGIAGELAAIYNRELKPLDLSLPALGTAAPIGIDIQDGACSRYLGLAIDGVQQVRSPDWLRFLLLAVGQRPLDLLVDLSNFVMLDVGQPNHAFDRAQVEAGIQVRMARKGESMTTLDGEERKLGVEDLLICASDKPVALAGVMGGEGSKVAPETSQLLLEVATFHPATVRRTSSRLGLRTDSSARFEKHLDPTLPPKAAAHFARLLQGIQPGVSFPAQLADAGEWADPALTLTLRLERVHKALGKAIPADEVSGILTRLGFGVRAVEAGFEVDVPSARATKDVTIEADLVEEIGRIHRYGNLPEAALYGPVQPAQVDPRRRLVRAIQDRLAGAARFHEVLSYSFQREGLLELLGAADAPHVQVINPVAPDEARIRRDVLPSLLEKLEANRRIVAEVRLFELGKGYRPEEADDHGQPREVHQLAMVLAAEPAAQPAAWDSGALQRLHGSVVDLFASLELDPPSAAVADAPAPWAHPAKTLTLSVGEVELGCLAELEPGVVRGLGLGGELQSDVAVAVLDLAALEALPAGGKPYAPIPRFPGIKVDVAVLVSEEVSAGDVQQAIEQAGKGAVADMELFDVYRGDSLEAGQRSLAFHVLLQSPTKTLSDKEAQKFLGRLERLLEQSGAELRRG